MGTDPASATWRSRLFARIGAHAPIKAFGTTLFITTFFIAYFWVLENPLFAVTTLPLTAVDHAISFSSTTLPAYLSLWVYVSLPPALIGDRRALDAFGVSVGTLCLLGLGIFVAWPTTIPTDLVDWNAYPEMELLRGIDAAGNACPSMHVATAVFSGLWLHRLLREIDAPTALFTVNALWCGAIVYSTMAVKQHVFIDVVGGLLLGALLAWPSLRWHARHMRSIALEATPGELR